jgi:transcriptional regulator with XRE-family HTH domain
MFKSLILIRKEQGISQKEMANILNVTSVSLNRYEKNKREIPHRLLVKYADYLGYELRLLKK